MGGPHTEVGLKPQLSHRGGVTKEEEKKSFRSAAQTTDLIPLIGLVNPASMEYLNGQQVFPN